MNYKAPCEKKPAVKVEKACSSCCIILEFTPHQALTNFFGKALILGTHAIQNPVVNKNFGCPTVIFWSSLIRLSYLILNQ